MIERAIVGPNGNLLAAVDKDVSTIIDEINKGINPNDFANNSLMADKLRTKGIVNFGRYMGTVANNGWANIFLGLIPNTGVSTKAYPLCAAFVDWFIDPTGVTPTTPNLGQALYDTGNSPIPYSNAHQGTAGIAFGGVGGGAATDARDQFYTSCQAANRFPLDQFGKLGIASYVLALENLSGLSHDVYFSFSWVCIAQASFA